MSKKLPLINPQDYFKKSSKPVTIFEDVQKQMIEEETLLTGNFEEDEIMFEKYIKVGKYKLEITIEPIILNRQFEYEFYDYNSVSYVIEANGLKEAVEKGKKLAEDMNGKLFSTQRI